MPKDLTTSHIDRQYFNISWTIERYIASFYTGQFGTDINAGTKLQVLPSCYMS
jgi:hypothetical protein